MHIRLEPDALGHRVSYRLSALDRIGLISKQIADGDFAAFEEAGPQHAVGGQAQSVAR
jgi:hypothetical protein